MELYYQISVGTLLAVESLSTYGARLVAFRLRARVF